jgi:hypothetical protein
VTPSLYRCQVYGKASDHAAMRVAVTTRETKKDPELYCASFLNQMTEDISAIGSEFIYADSRRL